jgi:hypothetical protein
MLWKRNDLSRFRFRFWKSFSYGSGSGSGSGSRQYLAQFPKTKKIAQNLAFSIQKQLISQKVLDFFTFLLHLCLIQIRFRNRNALGSGSSSAKTKIYGSCGSGSGSTIHCSGVPEKVIVHAVVDIEEALGELPVLHNLQQLHHATLKGIAA